VKAPEIGLKAQPSINKGIIKMRFKPSGKLIHLRIYLKKKHAQGVYGEIGDYIKKGDGISTIPFCVILH
jgi:hypothetical protein